jgi:8-oxo-dGTP pyrophosphatase MutT (NUDIX family)
MNFCSACGAKVSLRTIAGDNRQRFVCSGCGKTHYQNPNVLVAAYVCVGDKILWIRRGIPPAVGKWAMPGGFMESDETPEAAATRELEEETGIKIDADLMMLTSVSSILNMAQTHLVFRCHLDEMPEFCYRWLRNGNYGIRVGFIDESGSQYRVYPLADSDPSWIDR